MRHVARALCTLIVLAGTASAQSIANDDEPSLLASTLSAKSLFDQTASGNDPAQNRSCPACPRRSVGRALLQTTIVNAFYEAANLIRGQVTARITPKTWWANMEQGWVWDLDDFTVNQIGHPYQGSNYFNAGRANGLGFYESAAMAAFGSATWEYYGETNKPSLNDFINTTLGGVAWGEVLHRAAWLVRDPTASGRGRLMREIGAMVLDPVTGYNRFRTGDASRVVDKPAEFVPSSLTGSASAGVLWRGTEEDPFGATGQPFLEMDLLYGDLQHGRTRTPYDAFAMSLRFGGGGGISEARFIGRLLSQPLSRERLQFSVTQNYNFENNDAYSFGAQSFDGSLGFTHPLSSRISLWLVGSGGLTVLGAIESLPLGVDKEPVDEPESTGGQGVSEGPRYYDYGPGSNLGARAIFTRDQRGFAVALYEARHLYSLDGVRANHLLQHGRLDLRLPLRGRFGIGTCAEYFKRHTYYQDAAKTERVFWYPQFRAYLTWGIS